jgi:ribosomal protein L35
MSIKTNKSLTKRLKITKNGKILSRAPGFNHFNAKQSRSKQLAGKKMKDFSISNKNRRTYLANSTV